MTEVRVIVERRLTMLMLALAMAGPVSAAAQAQPPYSVSVTSEGTPFMTLTARDAKLSDVAAEVEKRLKAKVIVAPSLKDARVTVQIAGTPIEAAMLALAPRVFVDYELRRDAQPVAVGIYLLGLEDPEPAVSAVVQGNSQGLMVSGNTEDTGEPPKDAPLRITYARGRLSVFAKEQPMIAVVMAIADEIGVPAEIKYPSREVISTDIKESPMIDDVLFGLSDAVRVYVRADANRLEKRLLRVVVVGPSAK